MSVLPKGLAVPYMGSKNKIADRIVSKIINDNPNAKYFYDLFGGGGAISFEALRRNRFERVIYNELNTGVVELLRDITKNGMQERHWQWVDRETFEAHKGDSDWFGGLLKTCWSFGNNQKDYLFGRDIEEVKKHAHIAVVDQNTDSLDKLSELIGIDIPHSVIAENLLFPTTVKDRRIALRQHTNKINGRFDMQSLERLQSLEIFNESYMDVTIDTPQNETVIYLDPPYRGTATYELDIDHDHLFEWISKQECAVYVSSYEFDGLDCVLEIDHRSTLSATSNNSVKERLFCKPKN